MFRKIFSWILIVYAGILFAKDNKVSIPSIQIPENSVTLLFGGDTHFLWGVEDLQKQKGIFTPISLIQHIFHRVDFRALNIETVLSYNGRTKNHKNYVFRSSPENLQLLNFLKINLALLGNNHAFDLKEEGLKEMLEYFRMYGIPAIGAGFTIQDALEPLIVNIKGISFAIFSISLIGKKHSYARKNRPGIAGLNPFLYKKIKTVKKQVEYIIVSIHWGQEYNPYPTQYQKKITKLLWKHGVNFIIGHHPHIPQGLEVYSDRLVIYSLGNFLFGSANYLQNNNVLAILHFHPKTKQFLGVELLPITGIYRKYGYQIREPEKEDRLKLFREIYVLSKKEKSNQYFYISKNSKSLLITAQD